MTRVFFLCPDNNSAVGGIKKIYDNVDILNKNGIEAYVVHSKAGFRCTWFENTTRVVYDSNLGTITLSDIFVFPEIYGPQMGDLLKGVKKVIFNQNCYYTFKGYDINPRNKLTPYTHPDIVGAIVVSEDSKQYLNYAFPDLKVYRIHNSINTEIFKYSEEKKKQICFMPRKHPDEALQVLNILKFRGVLDEFTIIPIDNMSEAEVARVLSESLIFLNFGYPEGNPLPPLEAHLSGCILVGYHGFGGREYVNGEFAYPVGIADIVGFARTTEEVINTWKASPEKVFERAKKGRDYALLNHSKEREEQDIVSAWREILKPRPVKF